MAKIHKKVILLDRDGVINVKAEKHEYITSSKDFRLLPGAIKAIRKLNQKGYQIYIITNQAGIARGKMTENDLKTIHQKMLTEFRKRGAKINGIYYCPHGYNACECRKPKPGMFIQASKDHHFRLSRAVYISDDETDLSVGKIIGCKTYLVTQKVSLLDIVYLLE